MKLPWACSAVVSMATWLDFVKDAAEDVASFLQAMDDDEEDDEQPTPGSSSRKKNLSKKPVKKTVMKKKQTGAGDAGWKKCKGCMKWKEEDEYNASQARCRDCYNDSRALLRVAERQGQKTALEKMEQDEPRMHSALLKAFMKERASAKKNATKIKFSICSFVVTYKAESGIRKRAEHEFMWEGEFKEWATKTAKGGFLSNQEAQDQWNAMVDDPSHERDNGGPWNFLRILVKVRDTVIDYDEVARQKNLSKEEKLSKNASAELIQGRLKLAMGEEDLGNHDFGDLQALKDKARDIMSHGAQGSLFADEGLLAADVETLAGEVKQKLKKRTCVKFASNCGFCM